MEVANTNAQWIERLRHQLSAPALIDARSQIDLFGTLNQKPAEAFGEKDPLKEIEEHLTHSSMVAMELWSGSERVDFFAFQAALSLKGKELMLWKATTTVYFSRIQRNCTVLELERLARFPFYAVMLPVYSAKTVVRSAGYLNALNHGWDEKSLLRRSAKVLLRNGFSEQSVALIKLFKANQKK